MSPENEDMVDLIEDCVRRGVCLGMTSTEKLSAGITMELDRLLVRKNVERGKLMKVIPPKYHGLCFCFCFCSVGFATNLVWVCVALNYVYADSIEFEFKLKKKSEWSVDGNDCTR